MTSIKKRKKLWFILLPVAVVLIAAGVVLWLVLGQRAPTGPFAILRDQNTNEIVSCKLQQGIDLNTRPALPWDFYQLELPEGWQHEVDAAQSANRLSDIYEDHYLDEQLKEIVFLQSPAFLDWELFRPGARWDIPQQLQEVWFGDRQLMYGNRDLLLAAEPAESILEEKENFFRNWSSTTFQAS